MRIDLPMYTQKCKQGDGTKRNINPKNLVTKLSEPDVRICAVTNHNKFHETEYGSTKTLEPDLTIFPGLS